VTPIAEVEELNARFSKQGRIEFEAGPGGIAVARLESGGSSARVSLLGATVLSYIPEGHREVLFLSRRSAFQEGKAIRGGLPLCLPWFGGDPLGAGLPKHGFFRLFVWEVAESSFERGGSSVLLSLADTEATRRFWPRAFRAECRVTLGDCLAVSIKLINAGTEAFELSCAFHPYFAVSNLGKVELPTLEGKEYQDCLAPAAARAAITGGAEVPAAAKLTQAGALRFSDEVDRIYSYNGPVDVADPAAGRRIRVAGFGTARTVVWNPWKDSCAAMADLEPGDYLRYLCVEPAIVAPPRLLVEPGAAFEAGMSVEVEPI
jgi:glucose-6-phosphate 1-epimerase